MAIPRFDRPDQLHRFIGGRRAVNAARRRRAAERLPEVWAAHQRGEPAASIAKRYGVHRSSITRQLRGEYERQAAAMMEAGTVGDFFSAELTKLEKWL